MQPMYIYEAGAAAVAMHPDSIALNHASREISINAELMISTMPSVRFPRGKSIFSFLQNSCQLTVRGILSRGVEVERLCKVSRQPC